MIRQTTPPRYETNFTRMVDEDILRCEQFLAGGRDEKAGSELHLELAAKYPTYIAQFGAHLRKFNQQNGFVMLEYYDGDAISDDLIVMRSRLVAFKNHGYRNGNIMPEGGGRGVKLAPPAVQNPTSGATFAEVRQRIQEMTGLTDAKTADVLEKVGALEAIVCSGEPKKAKWQKVRPILSWLADESADVGNVLLPLFMKIEG
ncbi:hypothetical protein SDC9_55021 [bioreactor metagenome]|uniref:Uncharacterized protein n=1 Tax=bioreactor metagenome TaxID=1076179 RepID=A0A644WYC9_9ZZZZ